MITFEEVLHGLFPSLMVADQLVLGAPLAGWSLCLKENIEN